MTSHDWMQIIGMGVNVSVLVLAVAAVRKFTIMEFKVNEMYGVFSRRFGTRTESQEELE